MRSRVYETVERPSVRPSVRPITRPLHAAAPGLLLGAVQAGDVDRQRRVHGAQQQMRAVSCLQPP